MKKIISLFLIVALLITTVCGCAKKKRAVETFAMYTDNFEITEKMLTYYFNLQYLSFVTSNYDNLESFGLDTTQPLSEQNCPINGSNWYDYFMDTAKEKLTQCLIVSEMYKKKNKPITAKETKQVEDSIEILKKQAKENGTNFEKYIQTQFGEGVTEDDIRKVSEMEALTSRYYKAFEKDLDTSPKALEKYFEGHSKMYSTVDYLYFYISPLGQTNSDTTGAQRTAINLSQAENSDEFLNMVEAYVKEYYELYYSGNIDKKTVKEKVKLARESCAVYEAGYDSSSPASRWAFSEERVVNEGHYLIDEETGGYHVYYLTSLPSRQEYKSVDIRQIVFDPEDYENSDAAFSKAQSVLLNLADNEYSKASFKKFAKKYSADTISKNNGGLYTNVTKGSIVNATELESWIFDATREVGDIQLLETDEYGYHIVYIDKIGKPVWQLQILEGMVASKFGQHVSDLGDDYLLHINDNVVYRISEIDYSKIA